MPTAATTPLQLITDAAVLAGVVDPRESLAAGDAQFMLGALHRMIGSWANERLLSFETYIDTLALTASQASYSTTLLAHGNAQQWDNAFVRLSGVDHPLELIDQQSYNAISYKPSSGIPSALYVATDYPDSTLYFFPVPFGPMTAYIAARQWLIDATAGLTDTVQLPRGYSAAITDNLALALATAYGLQPSPQLVASAQNAKMVLKRNNRVALEMDSGVRGGQQRYNIFAG